MKGERAFPDAREESGDLVGRDIEPLPRLGRLRHQRPHQALQKLNSLRWAVLRNQLRRIRAAPAPPAREIPVTGDGHIIKTFH